MKGVAMTGKVYCYNCVYYGGNKAVMKKSDLADDGLDIKCRHEENMVDSWFAPRSGINLEDYCSEINSMNSCRNHKSVKFEGDIPKKPKKKEKKEDN